MAQAAVSRPSISGYLQVRDALMRHGGARLGLRRFKLMAPGRLGRMGYYVQGIDKTNNDSPTDDHPYLQEARLWLDGRWGRLSLGQFKPPFGRERFTPDTNLPTMDRAWATDHLIPDGTLGEGFSRDLGIQWEAGHPVHAELALFEGYGANNGLRRPAPLVAGRLVWRAYRTQRAALSLGIAASTRRASRIDFSRALPGTAVLGYGHFTGRDRRWNGELTATTGPLSWRAEWFGATFSATGDDLPSVRARGYYLVVEDHLTPAWAIALKGEGFDPNRAISDRHDLHALTLGLTYDDHPHRFRVQVEAVRRDERVEVAGNDAVRIQLQKWFGDR